MIEQFIQMAVQQLGAPQKDVEEATSGLLSVLQQQAQGSDFSGLLSKITGAETLMNQYKAGTASSDSMGDGLMGGIMGAVGGMLGGSSAGNLAGIASLLSQINLDAGQMGTLGSLFFDFIKSEAGQDIAQNLMGGLSGFLQSDAA